MLLRRTRQIWKRKVQGAIFSAAAMQDLLDEREKQTLEDSMGFRGQWEEHRRFQIELLKTLGLKPGHRFLEIGCGPLTAGIPLIDYLEPARYVGVDVRASVLDLSWTQIGRHGLSAKNPRLIRSDHFAARELANDTFDFVWSFSVLYHLTDEILDALLANVAKRLAPGGNYYANVMTDMDDSRWLEFPFVRRTVDDYRALAAQQGLDVKDLGSIAELGFRLPGAERTNPFLRFSPRR